MATSTPTGSTGEAHGAPPLLEDEVWAGQLSGWAAHLPRPSSILIVSAHWQTRGQIRATAWRNAPLVYDLTKDKDTLQIMRFIFGPSEISRPFAVGPGGPDDRVAALRKAFWEAAHSPDPLADAKKRRLIVNPMDWKETETAFREMLDVSPAIVARAKKAIAK